MRCVPCAPRPLERGVAVVSVITKCLIFTGAFHVVATSITTSHRQPVHIKSVFSVHHEKNTEESAARKKAARHGGTDVESNVA